GTDPSGLRLFADGKNIAQEYLKFLRGQAGSISRAGFKWQGLTGVNMRRLDDGRYLFTASDPDAVKNAAAKFRTRGWEEDAARLDALLAEKDHAEIRWVVSPGSRYQDPGEDDQFDIQTRFWKEHSYGRRVLSSYLDLSPFGNPVRAVDTGNPFYAWPV